MTGDGNEFRHKLAELVGDIFATNAAASQGIDALLVGQRVTSAAMEVWDGDGNWSIRLSFEDGSTIDVPGTTYATGPLADHVRMAGGQPQPPH
jgi:hypothetical protein